MVLGQYTNLTILGGGVVYMTTFNVKNRVCVCVCVCVCEGDTDRVTERDRQTDRQTDRQKERQTELKRCAGTAPTQGKDCALKGM